ncbi:MAG TPA: hypothetical protein VH280_13400 [Verrucomicrobiae bacterium]|nr:hypothetical protein [Verrucomicrobiae bacterium]
MKKLTPKVMRLAVALIEQLRSGLLDDAQQSDVVVQLDSLLLDPHWLGYTIDHVPELSPEEVVRKAFAYSPFLMPGPSGQSQS